MMDYRARYIRLGLMVVIIFLLLALPWTYVRYEMKKNRANGPEPAYVDNPVKAITEETARQDIKTFLEKTYPKDPAARTRLLPRQIHAFEYLRQQQLNPLDGQRLSDLLKTDYPDFYNIQLKFQDRHQPPK